MPDGREITIKSVGPEDAPKVKLHREATAAETHFMAREPEDGQLNLDKITEILGSFMMQIALGQAKANGFEQVELGVYSDNDRAKVMQERTVELGLITGEELKTWKSREKNEAKYVPC